MADLRATGIADQIGGGRMKITFIWVVACCICAMAFSGCSIKKIAVNSLGNALSNGSSTFAKDDDPELVGDAIPFALKTMESLLEISPRHRGL